MAISYIQSASTSGISNTPLTLSVAYPSNVTAGNLLFVAFEDDTGETSGTITASISDTLGNIWVPFPTGATSMDTALTGFNMNFFYCFANATGANTVSCHNTWSGGTFGSRASGLIVAEYSGITTKDQVTGASTNSGFSSSGNITITEAIELILSVVVEDSTVTGGNLTAGAGYTSRQSINSGILSSGRAIWMMLQDTITSTIGAYNPPFGGGPGKGGTSGTISFFRPVISSQVGVGILIDEISGVFEVLPISTNDPPQLNPSSTVLSNRFYLSQGATPPVGRHCQIQLSGGATNTKDEVLALCIRGEIINEQN